MSPLIDNNHIPYFQQDKTQKNGYNPLEENDQDLNILFHGNDILNNNCDYF